jgi:YVTN family beta-propeller protein
MRTGVNRDTQARRTRLWLVVATATALGLPAVGSGAFPVDQASAAPSSTGPSPTVRMAVGRPGPLPRGAVRLGPARSTTPVHLEIALKPRDPGTLATLATAVSSPGSARYRHFLPPGQLSRLFGPTPATTSSVRATLTRAGFTLGPTSANGLLIPLSTTVGRAERVFRTPITSYRLASGRVAIANTDPPSVPSSVAPAIDTVIGLDTTSQMQPQDLSSPVPPVGPVETHTTVTQAGPGPQPCAAAAGTGSSLDAYTGADISQAYSFNGLYENGDFGSGATVALFELEPYEASDIAAFQTCYGTDTSLSTVRVDGGAGKGRGAGEATLDIDNVIELAPEAHIDVYEAPNTLEGAVDEYTRIASTDSAQVISTSWGQCEAFSRQTASAERTIFEEMAAQGQSVFAATGDSGAEDCIPNEGAYTMPAGIDPVALAPDSGTGTVYVANKGSADVTVESEARVARVGTVPVGSGPDAVAVDPDTHDVYIAHDTIPGSVSVLAGTTCDAKSQSNCAVTTIPGLGDDPDGIAVDASDGTVYVADKGSGMLSVISEESNSVVGSVTLGKGTSPLGVAVDENTHDVYVTDSGSASLSVIDGASCNASETTGCGATPSLISTGDTTTPQAVIVSSATDTIYVTLWGPTGNQGLLRVDGATGTVSRTVFSGSTEPAGVALTQDSGHVLVLDAGDSSLSVLSTSTMDVTTLLRANSSADALVVDPSTDNAFTADLGPTAKQPGKVTIMPMALGVDDPASQPDVTAVGGTDLTSVSGPAETAWGDSSVGAGQEPEGAGGGGISSLFPMPSYQTGIVNSESSGSPCGADPGAYCREVPDVSASADFQNGYIVYESFWTTVGGTSGAAPVWAALTALAVTRNGTVERLGNLNPALYALASEGMPDFNDVVSGDNDFTTTNNGSYPALIGYDMATGLGSPIGSALAANLNPVDVTTEPSSQTAVAGQTVAFTVAVAGTPIPTVQWEESEDGGVTFSTILGATSDTYSLTADASDNGDEFEALCTNAAGSASTVVAGLRVFAIVTTTLPDATRGVAYHAQLQTVGGPPAGWILTGSLPKGMTMTSHGVLSGTPKEGQAPSTYTVSVTASTAKAKGRPALVTSQTLMLTLQ